MKLKKGILVLILAVILSATVSGQQTAQTAVVREVDYLLYLPEGYGEDPETEWPLLIFLHGAGEKGTEVERLKVTGLPRHIEEGNCYPFVIVSPQERRVNGGWDVNTLYEFYMKIIEEYRIDRDRVYLTGLSMGGFGTWNFAAMYPDLFAAIIPICGGSHFPQLLRRLKKTPVWCFHGDADDVVSIDYSQQAVDALMEVGGDVKFTVYPGGGHDSWTETYTNPEIYEWLLQHKRFRNVAVELDDDILDRYTGIYVSNSYDNEMVLRVKTEGKKLRTFMDEHDGPTLEALNETEFFYEEYAPDQVTFQIDAEGKVSGVYFNSIYFERTE